MQVISEGLLKLDPGLFLWTVITFLVLLAILWKTAWKPIVGALDARAEKIHGDIEIAERNRKEAEELLAKYESMMKSSREEASEMIAKSKEEAESLKNQIIDDARKEAGEIADRSRKEIELAKDKALSDLKSEIVTISTDIASRIIKKNLAPEDQKGLVEEALDKMRTVQ